MVGLLAADVVLSNTKVVRNAPQWTYRCNRKGHFSSRCFSKTTGPTPLEEVDSSLPEIETAAPFWMLSTIMSSWKVSLTVQNTQVEFTGAADAAITEKAYEALH